MHSSTLASTLLRTAAVREYQVRQTARGADIAVAARAVLDSTALAAAAEDDLRLAGVTAPRVTISRVQAIDRDPRTGKARRFLPVDPGAA